MGNNVCYHFIINIFATFCWLNTDHQKTLSKAVCTYLSTNCHVYVACVRCVNMCACRAKWCHWMDDESNQTESNRTESYRTVPYRTEPNQTELNRTEPNRTESNRTEPNRTKSNRTKPNWFESNRTEPNRIGPDHIKFDISFFLYCFTNYIIEKSHKLFTSATRLR